MELIKETFSNNLHKSKIQYCPYCGKEYKLFEFPIFQTKTMKRYCPDCDCMEREREKVELQKQEELNKNSLKKRFNNSMMSELFQEKTFNNLDPMIEAEIFNHCQEYAKNFIPKTCKGIQMIGNIGTGKTTLLAAICNELMNKGYNCLFTTLSGLLDKFSEYSYNHAGNITPLLNWLCKFDFVVLDDIGRETYTDKRKETVFRIIDSLINNKVVTAFTANPEMISKLKSIPELNAALDRLRGACTLQFTFRGNSLR